MRPSCDALVAVRSSLDRCVDWIARIREREQVRVLRSWAIIVLATVGLATAYDDAATPPPPQAATAVQNSHPAVDLAARSTTVDQFAAEAQRRDLAFVCGQGGMHPGWEVCMVRSAGVVAVVGFGDTAGIRVRLTGRSHDGVLVPLAPDVVYGVVEPTGRVRLLIESGGREIGELESQL